MYDNRFLPLVSLAFILLLSACLTGVSSQGLMGGFKGHHRGTGAVELLLATGILAKLLNHRAKHGPSYAGRHILHALLGPRYPPRFTPGRYPIEGHPSLLQDDIVEPHASMAIPFQDELMLNQESALLGAKAPFLMNPTMPILTADNQLLAEAQLSQQLLAARRARKILEARKILAAQEARNILAVQREAAHILAAQEAAQAATILAANPSRQIFTAAHPPRMMAKQVNAGQQGQNEMMMGQERNIAARSDSKVFHLPPGLSEHETARIIAEIAKREG